MKKLIGLLLLLTASSVHAAKISVTIGTGALQPGTTAGMNISSGTIQNFNNVNQTSSGTYTINGGTFTFAIKNSSAPLITGFLRDVTTTTYQGAVTSGTITNVSTVTHMGSVSNGTRVDNATNTLTGANIFRNIVRVSTGMTQPATFSVNQSSVVVGASGSPGFTYGTQTNDAGPSGFVGEYISTYNPLTGNLTTGQWLDVSTITLTAGDWIVSGIVSIAPQTVGPVFTRVQIGISATAGNNSTGLADGDNEVDCFLPTSASNRGGCSIPQFRVSISATTPYYVKVNAAWATDTVKALGRISATRVR